MPTFVKLILIICLLNLNACSMKASPKYNEDTSQTNHTARINAQLGIAYLQKNDMQRAKQKLLLSLSQAPNIPEPWYSMAWFLEVTGNKPEANNYYLKAIAVSPQHGAAKNNYGAFLCRSGHYQAAIQQFLLAAHNPNYLNPASAYENAGLCAQKLPDSQQATRYFHHALKRDPTRLVSRQELALLPSAKSVPP